MRHTLRAAAAIIALAVLTSPAAAITKTSGGTYIRSQTETSGGKLVYDVIDAYTDNGDGTYRHSVVNNSVLTVDETVDSIPGGFGSSNGNWVYQYLDQSQRRQATVMPIPAAWALGAAGFVLLGALGHRRRQKHS